MFFFTVDLIGLLINSFFDKSNEERSHCSDGIVDDAVGIWYANSMAKRNRGTNVPCLYLG